MSSEWVRTLEFTTVSSCAVDCSYCPQGALKAAYKGDASLSYGRFCDVVDALPPDVVIHFSGFVEPWLNRSCTEMLLYALSKRRRISVYTTLVGMREPELVASVYLQWRHLFDHFCIHLPDTGGNMPVRPKPEAVAAFRGVNGLEWMSMGEPLIEPGPMNDWSPNDRAGSLTAKRLPLTKHVGPIRCSYTPTYEHNVILPNGDVVLCCQDYALRHPLGNLFTHSWDDLQFARDDVRLANLNEEDTICRRCNGAERA